MMSAMTRENRPSKFPEDTVPSVASRSKPSESLAAFSIEPRITGLGRNEGLLLLGVGSDGSPFILGNVATWFGEGRFVVLRVLSLFALYLCSARVFGAMLPKLATGRLAILG
jgi:hypothetical protein